MGQQTSFIVESQVARTDFTFNFVGVSALEEKEKIVYGVFGFPLKIQMSNSIQQVSLQVTKTLNSWSNFHSIEFTDRDQFCLGAYIFLRNQTHSWRASFVNCKLAIIMMLISVQVYSFTKGVLFVVSDELWSANYLDISFFVKSRQGTYCIIHQVCYSI